MKNILRIIALIFVVTAIAQLLGIGERIFHALWQWYKFYGYSNSGQTTINTKIAVFTFITSGTLIALGYFIKEKVTEQYVKKAIIYSYSYSYSSISVGILLLTVLLLSPISKLVVR